MNNRPIERKVLNVFLLRSVGRREADRDSTEIMMNKHKLPDWKEFLELLYIFFPTFLRQVGGSGEVSNQKGKSKETSKRRRGGCSRRPARDILASWDKMEERPISRRSLFSFFVPPFC